MIGTREKMPDFIHKTNGVIIAAWLCLVAASACIYWSLAAFYFYVPLVAASLTLAVVAIARRRLVNGVVTFLLSILIPAVLVVFLLNDGTRDKYPLVSLFGQTHSSYRTGAYSMDTTDQLIDDPDQLYANKGLDNSYSPVVASTRKPAPTPQADNISNLQKTERMKYVEMVRHEFAMYKFYPESARRQGIHGVVRLYVEISSMGYVDSLSVARSSGYKRLDQAAKQMILRASPLRPFPDGLHQGKLTLVIPVRYSLK